MCKINVQFFFVHFLSQSLLLKVNLTSLPHWSRLWTTPTLPCLPSQPPPPPSTLLLPPPPPTPLTRLPLISRGSTPLSQLLHPPLIWMRPTPSLAELNQDFLPRVLEYEIRMMLVPHLQLPPLFPCPLLHVALRPQLLTIVLVTVLVQNGLDSG